MLVATCFDHHNESPLSIFQLSKRSTAMRLSLLFCLCTFTFFFSVLIDVVDCRPLLGAGFPSINPSTLAWSPLDPGFNSSFNDVVSVDMRVLGIPWRELSLGLPVPSAWNSSVASAATNAMNTGQPILLLCSPFGPRPVSAGWSPQAVCPAESPITSASTPGGFYLETDTNCTKSRTGCFDDWGSRLGTYETYLNFILNQFGSNVAYLQIASDVNLLSRDCGPLPLAHLISAFLNPLYSSLKVRFDSIFSIFILT